jgi:hypothetical protein
MSTSNPIGKIDFPECLRTILYESYGATEAETYAYYQRNCRSMFQAEADNFNLDPHYFRVHAAVSLLECTCFTHEDIDFFEVTNKKSGDEVTLLSREYFFDIRNDFYENDGRRINSKKEPMSLLCFSKNILVRLGADMGISLFNRRVILNDFAQQMEAIYREMKKRNYHLSEKTTVKEFYRDIIIHVFAQMSKHDQNYCWRILKSQEVLILR